MDDHESLIKFSCHIKSNKTKYTVKDKPFIKFIIIFQILGINLLQKSIILDYPISQKIDR